MVQTVVLVMVMVLVPVTGTVQVLEPEVTVDEVTGGIVSMCGSRDMLW